MPQFDPVTGRVLDREALLSIAVNPAPTRDRSKVVDGRLITQLVDQNDGSQAAVLTEHKTGRVDANVTPSPVKAKVT